MNRKLVLFSGAFVAGMLAALPATAKVSPEKAKELDGPTYQALCGKAGIRPC